MALIAGALLALSGCADGDTEGPRPLTQAEAERLAVVRFRNFDAGVRSLDVTIPATADTSAVRLSGWSDFAAHTGYTVAAEGPADIAAVTGMVAWAAVDTAVIGIHGAEVGSAPGDFPPLPPPSEGWTVAPVTEDGSGLLEAVRVLQQLGSDRPENASLLMQSDASWLRSDEVNGAAVDVFVGPSPAGTTGTATTLPVTERIVYWVDDTGTALRVDLPSGTVIRLSDGTGVTLNELSDSLTASLTANEN